MRGAPGRALLLLVGGAVLPGCAGPAVEAWCGGEGDAAVVVSRSDAGTWDRSRTLTELWRVGGEDGLALLGPSDADASVSARLAIPDARLGEVAIVSPGGRTATWPAADATDALRSPAAAAWAGADTLVVLDLAGPRTVHLRDGVPVRALALAHAPDELGGGTGAGSVDVQPGGGVVLLTAAEPLEGAPDGVRTLSLIRIPPDPSGPDTLAVDTIRSMPGDRFAGWRLPGEPRLAFAVGPAGRIAVGGRDHRYRIVVMDAEGRAEAVICRAAEPYAVSPRERGVVADPEAPPGLVALIRDASPADAPAATGHLFYGAGGRLWVQRNRRAPLDTSPIPGVGGAVHDVFDPQGRFLGTVTAPGGVRLVTAAGDTVFGLEQDELGRRWLVALALQGD